MTVYSYDPQSLENHGKSFYWASFFLPNKNKDVASELYSICRYFDDLADETPADQSENCLLYTSPSPRDKRQSRMPSSA